MKRKTIKTKHVRSVGESQRTPGNPCLNCGKLIDAARGINQENAVHPGAATICLYCGHLMIFGENLKLREPTPAEVVELAGDPDILAAMEVSALWRRNHLPSGE